MASLINDLIHVVKEETGCYKTLLDMASNKKDVIIKGDLPSLQQISEDEQVVAGQILRLEKKREATIKDISLVTGEKTTDLILTRIIELLSGNDEQEELIEAKEDLQKVVLLLKESNKTNETLLKHSLEFYDFMMNALISSRDTEIMNNYDTDPKNSSMSFFDSKR